jgi:hypothetical protein
LNNCTIGRSPGFESINSFLFLVSKCLVPPIYFIGGIFMLDRPEEKKIVYELMRELIAERRELSTQYYDLKERLDSLNTLPNMPNLKKETATTSSLIEKEQIQERDTFHRKYKGAHYLPFDRVSKNILSILKQSPVPLSNKQILEKLNTEYDLHVTYQNLSANILPKMLKERSLPIEKSCRGYWQYHLPKL